MNVPALKDRDADAFAFVVQCGKVAELALHAAALDAAEGKSGWADYHQRRAEERAQMALFVASGGRHG